MIDELSIYKAIAFYLLKTHRVKPEGERQNKAPEEIDEMTLATLEYMANNMNEKVLVDYFSAIERRE